ncbi:sulfite exporter TauE/SafE family protein [Gordonia sp. TBRC 11910]|uniref:Probable membrane transporter protein n=1 Tax=Gordonia asplenii TaxID=2725283 RepID=A0A848KS14_9ACTN|nr:sulfite exporter TauE/SafE family protein [Gordonia asplenii]NMO01220.1 sulfite exporter TauE/SafE family protein [Gordonia asplenii]
MTVLDLAFLVVAGFATGVVGYVTGLASIVSYPALLAVGLSPVAANVTNTVSLVAVGVGATAKASGKLFERGRTLAIWSACAAAGGIVGAVLLLASPADAFQLVVPYLVGAASIALLAQPIVRRHIGDAQVPHIIPVSVFLVSIYGGYFGAGAGVIFISLLLVFTAETMWDTAILKSFLLGVSNLVAAVGFAVFGPVNWTAALALGAGALVGGWCGPPIVAVIPPTFLRIAVGIGGLGLALWLALT